MNDNWEFKHKIEFEKILSESNVDKKSICLVGSITLSYFDLREPNDIDFVTIPKFRDKFETCERVTTPGIYPINERIELKSEYLYTFGISDSELIHNESYHMNINGFKIIRPELLYVYKYVQNDSYDVKLLEQFKTEWENWNSELVKQHHGGLSMSRRAIQSLRHFGLIHTIQEGKNKLTNLF